MTFVLSAGCTPFTDAYPGPFRSPNEVALVSGQPDPSEQLGFEPLFINSVDGKRAIGGWKAPTREVQILPGTHSIGVVEARAVEAAESAAVFKDQAILVFKVIVGAKYVLGYNPTTSEFMVARVGLGPVPFDRK